MVVRTEGAMPTAWVYVDVAGRDIGSYVARRAADGERDGDAAAGLLASCGAGSTSTCSAPQAQMKLVIPATLAIIFLLLYFNFRSVGETLIVMLSLPFALVGGIWFIWRARLQLVGRGGDRVHRARRRGRGDRRRDAHLSRSRVEGAQRHGERPTARDLYDAVVEGAVERVRPKMMTVTAIMAGLLPILWGNGTGASVMKRIAAPMVGGMISSTVLTLIVIPAVYSLWKERGLRAAAVEISKVKGGGYVHAS